MLDLGGKTLYGRLGLETQPTKTPKTPGLAYPTQAERPQINLSISAGSSRM